MIVKASEFVGALKAARLFACTDTTRMHMCCIHVEAVANALRFVSTDGHTLWCCEVPAQEFAADPAPAEQVSWNIRLEDVDAIARQLKELREVGVVLSKHQIEMTVYPSACEEFTRYAYVVPNVAAMKPGKAIPEFAASYVARCCEALALYGKGFAPEIPTKGTKQEKQSARTQRDQYVDPPIAWRTAGEYDPAIVWSPKFPAAFALVMPRRGQEISGVAVASFIERVRTEKPKTAA